MRKRLTLALGLASAAVAWAGVASAADAPWQPNSDLFKLNFRFASLALLLIALGIALGLVGAAIFRYRKIRIDITGGTVQRHSAGNMFTHWLNAAGFLLATYTGATFLRWLPRLVDLPTNYTLHYIGAGAILVGFIGTAANAAVRGTSTRRRLIPSGHQIKEAIYELFGYAGFVGDRGILGFKAVQWPKFMRDNIAQAIGFKDFEKSGKYLAAEEVLSYPFWALVGLAIIGTGILKSARFAYPLAAGVVQWLTIIHDWAAVGVVVMLCVHVGALVLVRTNWPLFGSMFTGKVSLEYVKAVHGAWYQELVAESERKGRPAAATTRAAAADQRGH